MPHQQPAILSERYHQVMDEIPKRTSLLRVLGLAFGIAVTVGNTIGAGILRAPGEVASQIPGLWPFLAVWVGAAAYAFLGANVVSELGTMLPRSGGQYVFARRALGDYAGFVAGWSDWLSTCGSITAVALLISEYTAALLPELNLRPLMIALAVIVAFAILQWRGVRWGNYAQQITTLLKTLAFVFLIGACFILGGRDAADVISEPMSRPAALLAWVLALQAVIFTFDGWAAPVYFSEEVRESQRDIPRAVFGGLSLITGIYLLLIIGF